MVKMAHAGEGHGNTSLISSSAMHSTSDGSSRSRRRKGARFSKEVLVPARMEIAFSEFYV